MTFAIITKNDSSYPDLLREIPDPPMRLWIQGDSLEPVPMVAVVGTRNPTRYGLDATRALSAGLARHGIVIVSGMARGIDAAAHRGALDAGGKSIAVLGCGLDLCYPKNHWMLKNEIARNGSVISEYKPGTPALPHHFPIRNRIIAGMCLAVVIVEGRLKGGAMITSRLGLEFGRDVFAVPGPVGSPQSEGPHLLIRDGARLVASANNVLEDMGFPVEEEPTFDFTPDEVRIIGLLAGEPVLLEVLAKRASVPASTVAAILARLELKGAITRHPGGRFSRAPLTIGL